MIALHVLVTALGVALGVFYPFISVILADFGFRPGEIGLISSLGAVGFTIAVPAWGHLADVRLGRPRTVLVCGLGAAVAVAGLLLPAPGLVVVALLLGFWVFESSWQPLADAITVTMVRGSDYARIRLFTSLGFAVAAVGSGFLYDAVGYRPSFVLFAIASIVMALAAATLPDLGRADLAAHRARSDAGNAATQRGSRPARRASFLAAFGSSGVAFRTAPRLAAVLVASGLLHVGIINGFTFLPLRLDALGGAPSDVALSSGLSAGSEIPAILVMGWLARRVALRLLFVGSAVLYAGCLASWTILDVPLAIVATRAVTGIAFSGVVVSVVLTIAELLPADLQATGQALFQTSAFGVAAILANVLGGLLYESLGHVALFGVGAVLALVAGVIGWAAFPAGHAGRPRAPVASG